MMVEICYISEIISSLFPFFWIGIKSATNAIIFTIAKVAFIIEGNKQWN